MTSTAHQVAADPARYNLAIYMAPTSRVPYDCMGYSKTGNKVRFGRIVTHKGQVLTTSVRYLDPNQIVYHEDIEVDDE